MLTEASIYRRQQGSSLIEVLVSMTIMAIGILGISGLQTASMKSNQNSYMRTQAVFHSLDIVERMHSNLAGVQAGAYNDPMPVLNSDCVTATGCSANQMAAHDVAEWKASVTTGLPLGSAIVCLDSDPSDGSADAPACDSAGDVYAVKLWWDDDRDGAANQKFVMAFQP